jgi:tRNA threonylcarbamoyladenosine biosynthesis protein TsaB
LRVLALDTTSERESVALADGDAVVGELRLRAADRHSRLVLGAVEFLLSRLGLAPRDIDAFAVTLGPGSFTGIRVGLSTVQGLALAASRPCLGLSTLDVLAARIVGEAEHLVALVDAYRDEVFAGLYDAEARPLAPARRQRPAELLPTLPPGAAFIGDGAERYAEEIRSVVTGSRLPRRSLYLAGTLARLAGPRLLAGEGQAPERLRPLYLREADIRPSPP